MKTELFKLSSIIAGIAKGFQITFANGYTVSVQWGAGNYCDNYFVRNFNEMPPDCVNAETAIFSPDGEFLEYKGDHVQARQTPAEVLETMNYAAALPEK